MQIFGAIGSQTSVPTVVQRWTEAKDNGDEIDRSTTMIEKKYYKSC